jgi:DNA polymerase I-like protein with 3'-5' exonuclease and polymerase domains
LHDEVILESREDFAEDVAKIVKTCLGSDIEKVIPGVPFKVEPKVKDSWEVIIYQS